MRTALALPNRAYEAVFSGGSWAPSMPAGHAGMKEMALRARSTNAASTSTVLLLDLGAARALRFFGLYRHNLSSAATWAVSIGTTSGGADVYAGSALTAWPMEASQGTLATLGMEQDSWRTAEDWISPIVLPAYYTGRYVKVEIFDTGNAAGYVQTRVWASGGLIPARAPALGLEHSRTPLSGQTRADGGAKWFSRRRAPRTARLVIDQVVAADAVVMREIERICDTTDDLLYLSDIDDLATCQRDSFVGNLSRLSGLQYPYTTDHRKGFEIEQRV